ncbi:MAG: serine/threonine-protein kinase [Thermoprotei archaeon]
MLYSATGLSAYFVPLVSYYLYPQAFAGQGSEVQGFVFESIVLAVYTPLLLSAKHRPGALLYIPFLIGLTVVLLWYGVQPEYWFFVYTPWMPAAVSASYLLNRYTLPVTVQVGPRKPRLPKRTKPTPTKQPLVRFVVTGLPPSVKAAVSVEGHDCYGDHTIDCPTHGGWWAYPVTVNNVTYYPVPDSGVATSGSVIRITYYPVTRTPKQPQQTHAPSRPLSPVTVPKTFDPNAVIGMDLGVHRVEKLLGEGGFGYVYVASMGGAKYAVKVLKVQGGRAEEYFQSLFQEASNLVNLSSHSNVVKIYAVDVDLNVIKRALAGDFTYYYVQPPRIVMEYMAGGSLDNYLNDDTFFYSSSWEKAVARAVKSVTEALDYVHSNGFVHLDVKPQNVFLTRKPGDPSDLKNVDFKLGDLGSAVRVGKPVTQVTTLYAPPEVYLEPAKPTMDVFALGMTLYVLLTRKNDRPDLRVMEDAFDCYVKGDMNCVKAKVGEARKLLAQWEPQVKEPYKSLIKAMTYPDPRGRPAARDVAKWLNGVV